MAEKCLQGRGVMIDLNAHVGRRHVAIGYDQLMRILDADKVVVETGDMVLLHTGFAAMLLEMEKRPDPYTLHHSCAALDGRDGRLLRWITDSGLAALIADNYAVEAVPACELKGRGASLPAARALPVQARRQSRRAVDAHAARRLAAHPRPVPLPAHRPAAAAARRGRLANDPGRDRVRIR